MAKRKIEKVESGDAEANKFAEDLSGFLEKSLGITLKSLRDYGKIPYWIDTRCLALNWIISNDFWGGFPGTYLSLIYGEPQKGKSLLVDVLLGSNIRMGGFSMKASIERAANYDFSAQVVGSEEIAAQIRLIKPKDKEKIITIETLTSIIYRLLDFQAAAKEKMNKSVLMGIDSITQLTSQKEIDGVEDRASGKKEHKDMTSAQEMRKLFRVIEQRMEYANVTIVGIGQLTANITTGFTPKGTPKKVINAKGTGYHYASSLNIQVLTDREILDASGNVPIGIRMRMKTTKNRVKFKGRSCWVCFYFNRGIDRFGGLPELLTTYDVVKPFIEKENEKGEIKRNKEKLNDSGLFIHTPKFSFIRPNGSEIIFDMTNISQILTEDILKEMNTALNNVYTSMLDSQGITPQAILESDDPSDEELDDTNNQEGEEHG